MKKLFALLASAVLAAAAIPRISPARQNVAAADKIKIMPAGDSITFGMGDDGGYRKYLDVQLKQKNIDFDMVGPEGPDTASFNYNGQNVTYDNNHAGYSGYTIKYHQGGYGDGLMETLQKKNALKSGQPDIILLIIGTNDMNSNRSMQECESDLRELMDYLIKEMPSGCMIFLSTIPELAGGFFGGGNTTQKIASYNDIVKKVANEYKGNGKNVTFADIHGCLDGTNDLGDGVHPNARGYEKMGKYFAGLIEDYLKNGSSSQPQQPQTTTAPQSPWDPWGPSTPTTTVSPANPSTPSSGGGKDKAYKVMPAGDSITFGMGDDGGYRKYFDYFMKEKGYSKIDMVGPEGPDTASFNYNGKSVTYDNNHAGYSGYTIKYHQGGYGDGLMETLQKKNALKSGQPDVILLIIGTNDMNSNRSMQECESDLRELMDYLIKEMPSGCMIFLSSIPELGGGFFGGGGNTAQKIASYNDIVKNVANEYKSAGKNVTFADIHGCLDGTNDLGDGVHPNARGYEKMGKYFAGLVDEYLSAQAPAVTTVVTTTTTATTTTTTTTEPVTTTTTTTTEAVTTPAPAQITKRGDATCDGKVDVSDAVLICRFVVADQNANITDTGRANADCDKDGGITMDDATMILKYIARMIDEIA